MITTLIDKFKQNVFTNEVDYGPVDLVVPYVDCEDTKWQELFNKYNPTKEISEATNSKCRFRGQGDFFRYFFRCIEKNFKFIRKIHLIVQSESQVPSWINRDEVHIVYHEDIIPKEFLPTFNSTTIEMFIPFIKGLSERFIYTNDDVYVLRPMSEDDFFFRNKIKTRFISGGCINTMYGHHKVNNYCMIFGENNRKIIEQCGRVLTLEHRMRPYLKSVCIECFNEHKDEIYDSISQFRETKNVNVYIYDLYARLIGRTLDRENRPSRIIYATKTSDNMKSNLYREPSTYMICLQDNEDADIYKNKMIRYLFHKDYSLLSKYETKGTTTLDYFY